MPRFARNDNQPAAKALHIPGQERIKNAHAHFHRRIHQQGGQSAMVLAMKEPQRVNRLVFGACHIRTGGDLYLMGNRPRKAA